MSATYWVFPASRLDDLRTAAKRSLGPNYENAVYSLLEHYPSVTIGGTSGELYPQLVTFLAEAGVPVSEASRTALAGELMISQGGTYWVFDHALADRCRAALGEAPIKLRDLAQYANEALGGRIEATYMKEAFAHFKAAVDACGPGDLVVVRAG